MNHDTYSIQYYTFRWLTQSKFQGFISRSFFIFSRKKLLDFYCVYVYIYAVFSRERKKVFGKKSVALVGKTSIVFTRANLIASAIMMIGAVFRQSGLGGNCCTTYFLFESILYCSRLSSTYKLHAKYCICHCSLYARYDSDVWNIFPLRIIAEIKSIKFMTRFLEKLYCFHRNVLHFPHVIMMISTPWKG